LSLFGTAPSRQVASGAEVLRDAIEAAARCAWDRPALVGVEGSLTYGELLELLPSRAETPARRVVHAMGTVEDAAAIVCLACAGDSVLVLDGRATEWEQGRAESVFADGPPRPGGDLGLCTSGTNGLPKVVELDWASELENAASFAAAARYRPSDVIWIATPLAHLYGLGAGVLAGLLSGATVLIAGGALGPQEFSERLLGSEASVLLTVPFLASRCARELSRISSPVRESRLRITIAAGEPVPEALVADWDDATGTPLLAHYGLTEGGHITLAGGGPGEGVGRPLPDVDVRLGADGMVHVRRRPPQRPYRIIGETPATDGWCPTGDLGRLDEAGNLHIGGRIGDRINLAGKKIDPAEVEGLLRRCPGVLDCAVAGVRRAVGVQVAAFITVAGEISDSELRGHLAKRLSPYKMPRQFIRVTQIPRTLTGKIRRGELIAGLEGGAPLPPVDPPVPRVDAAMRSS
jgi:long-chain acyl-CoA synthetase